MTIFWWIIGLYILGIFLIGLPMGKKSLKLWMKMAEIGGGSGGFWGHVLFPTSASDKCVGVWKKYSPTTLLFTEYFKSTNDLTLPDQKKLQEYIGLTGILWPIRITWNLFTLAVISLVSTIVFIAIYFSKLLGKLVTVR